MADCPRIFVVKDFERSRPAFIKDRLHAIGMTSFAPFQLRPTAPFDIGSFGDGVYYKQVRSPSGKNARCSYRDAMSGEQSAAREAQYDGSLVTYRINVGIAALQLAI
jgi:hypothetical protein